MVTLNHYLFVSGVLFTLGLTGVMLRRSLIVIFMSLEMMLSAANLSLEGVDRAVSGDLVLA